MSFTDLDTFKKQLQFSLTQGETSEVIALLKASLPQGSKKSLDITHLEIRFGALRKENLKGILSHEQKSISLNQINADILEFINCLKARDFAITESTRRRNFNIFILNKLIFKNYLWLIYTMIGLMIIFLTIWAMTNNKSKPPKPPLLSIFIFDNSYSSKYIEIDESELNKYCKGDTDRPINQFAVIFIKESGGDQLPYISDRVISQKKVYQNFMERKANLEEYNKALGESIAQVVRLSKVNHQDNYSDVNGALQTARLLCSQPNYSDYEIRILVFSDMLQSEHNSYPRDVPPNAIAFPKNVKIFLIGSKIHDYTKVFPSNPTSLLISFKSEFVN